MKSLYLPIFEELKLSTNLQKIQKKFSISKQKLNYYLRRLQKDGLIIKKGRGWYEVVKKSKNSTKYGKRLVKDSVRGHAYIWNIKLDKIPFGWGDRISVLKKNNIHYKLVGAKGTTPRIRVLGRKVWLCNTHLRIFDKKEESYYGKNARESKYLALQQIKLILNALNNKLGTNLHPSSITFQREHYALIKNDLAIEENRKGNIVRISDDEGEWLVIDDSLGKGGELETIGKGSLKTNIAMQKWWNEKKKNNFSIDDSFILNAFHKVYENQAMVVQNHLYNDKNIVKHQKVLDDMLVTLKDLRDTMQEMRDEIRKGL